jgi:predicted transcriptional regulator
MPDTQLEQFHRFLTGQLQNGGSLLSPEQVLAMWRERTETIAAIREGLEDLEQGRTRPAHEVLAELRNEPDTSTGA